MTFDKCLVKGIYYYDSNLFNVNYTFYKDGFICKLSNEI